MGNQKLPCFSYIGRETLGDQGLGEKNIRLYKIFREELPFLIYVQFMIYDIICLIN